MYKNRKALFNYEIQKEYLAGVQLLGSEVKSIRQNGVSFVDSYVIVISGEVYLIGAQISNLRGNPLLDHQVDRKRKLLLSKKEIQNISKEIQNGGMTCVPIELFWKKNLLKLKIAVARGKKLWDKRNAIKERVLSRERTED
jgi:SsrA-binding protein